MFDQFSAHPSCLKKELPRKAGVPDIVEGNIDEISIPEVISLVGKRKIRAAFLYETPAQKKERESWTQKELTKEFWSFAAEAGISLSLQDPFCIKTGEIPNLNFPTSILKIMVGQLSILQQGIIRCPDSDSMLLTGDKKGPYKIHNDPHVVTVHQTLFGPKGMSYIINPISEEEIKERILTRGHSVSRDSFVEELRSNLPETAEIPTGTITIFGPNFYHASSSEKQVAVSSSPGPSFSHPIRYVNG